MNAHCFRSTYGDGEVWFGTSNDQTSDVFKFSLAHS